jgi:hypothetical protein
MSQVGTRYTLSTDADLGFAEAVGRVRAELAAEGFGDGQRDLDGRRGPV